MPVDIRLFSFVVRNVVRNQERETITGWKRIIKESNTAVIIRDWAYHHMSTGNWLEKRWTWAAFVEYVHRSSAMLAALRDHPEKDVKAREWLTDPRHIPPDTRPIASNGIRWTDPDTVCLIVYGVARMTRC